MADGSLIPGSYCGNKGLCPGSHGNIGWSNTMSLVLHPVALEQSSVSIMQGCRQSKLGGMTSYSFRLWEVCYLKNIRANKEEYALSSFVFFFGVNKYGNLL